MKRVNPDTNNVASKKSNTPSVKAGQAEQARAKDVLFHAEIFINIAKWINLRTFRALSSTCKHNFLPEFINPCRIQSTHYTIREILNPKKFISEGFIDTRGLLKEDYTAEDIFNDNNDEESDAFGYLYITSCSPEQKNKINPAFEKFKLSLNNPVFGAWNYDDLYVTVHNQLPKECFQTVTQCISAIGNSIKTNGATCSITLNGCTQDIESIQHIFNMIDNTKCFHGLDGFVFLNSIFTKEMIAETMKQIQLHGVRIPRSYPENKPSFIIKFNHTGITDEILPQLLTSLAALISAFNKNIAPDALDKIDLSNNNINIIGAHLIINFVYELYKKALKELDDDQISLPSIVVSDNPVSKQLQPVIDGDNTLKRFISFEKQ